MQFASCRSVRLVCGYMYILVVTGVQMTGSGAPNFTSKGQTFRVVAGDPLLLPCSVDHLGTYVVLWRRASLILTADKLKVTRDPRMSLEDGFNLRIANVTSQDAGEYICQIADDVARNQIHNVQVLLPPMVQSAVPNGRLSAKRGGTVTLTCAASGNPMPSILWTRKGSPTLYKEGFSITLEKVDRHHSGVYQCSASNGVGSPVSVDLRLDVLHSPEVEVETPLIYTAEGVTVQLVCIVHGLPAPKVSWYRGPVRLAVQGRLSVGNSTTEPSTFRHWLAIDGIQTTDFTNYTCTAENNLGKASGTITLQGRPGQCVRLSSPYSHTTYSYNLTWSVDSYSPLEEVRLVYRRIMINDSLHEMGQWVEDSFHINNTNTSLHQRLWHDIQPLDEASVFQAQIQVRNRYGWGDLSDVFQFYTRAPNEDVVEHNMELLSSGSQALFPGIGVSALISAMLFWRGVQTIRV